MSQTFGEMYSGIRSLLLYSGDNILLSNRVFGGICVIGGKHRISSLQVSGSTFMLGPGRTIIIWRALCVHLRPLEEHLFGYFVFRHQTTVGSSGTKTYSGILANWYIRVFGQTAVFGYSGKQTHSGIRAYKYIPLIG